MVRERQHAMFSGTPWTMQAHVVDQEILGFLTLFSALIAALTVVRLYTIFPPTRIAKPSGRREDSDKCSFAVFLGSGPWFPAVRPARD